MDAHIKLIDLPQKDFDKSFCDLMVNGRKNAIIMFDNASAGCSNLKI